MAKGNFDRSLLLVLAHEGGWADHPKDPGGATMKGVTLATFRRYRPGATKADLRNISDADLQRIYRDGYWNVIRGDELPSGLDFAVFDYAVNSGPGRAAKHLQAVLGVPQDGKVGPITLAAAREADIERVIELLCTKRLGFLKSLPTWGTFGKGWERRVNSVLEDALLMAVAPVPPQPDVPHYPEQPAGGRKSPVAAVVALIVAAIVAAYSFLKSQGVPLP